MRLYILITVLLISITTILFSADETGTTSANFLKISPSARYLGIGEAFTALVDDPSALAVNPGGLGNIYNLEIMFSHYDYILDLDYEHLAVVKPVFTGLYKFKGVMGMSITYLHLPGFAQYNDWGEDIGQLNANDLAFTCGYGQKIFMFDAGITLKMIREQIDDLTEYAYGTDLGLIYTYKLPTSIFGIKNYGKRLKVGLSLLNLGIDDGINGYSLPTSFRLGLGTEIINDFILGLDFEKPIDNQLRINVGCEYNIKNYVNFRAGYRFLGYNVDSFTLGIGVRYPFGTKIFKVDAAYASAGALKNTTDLTFGVKFPGVTSEQDWKMANILYYKGIYYYTNGKLDKAIELWREVLKYNPDHERAKEKIKDAEYLKKLKEVENKVKYKYPGKEEPGTDETGQNTPEP